MVRPRAAPLSSISPNISVGDDTGGTSSSGPSTQGGSINMANFPLTPLSQPYALIAEAESVDRHRPLWTALHLRFDGLRLPADPTLGDFLQEGVIPAGFEVLQLLNPDGSTAS